MSIWKIKLRYTIFVLLISFLIFTMGCTKEPTATEIKNHASNTLDNSKEASQAQSPEKEHYNKGIAHAIEGKFEEAEKEFQAGLHTDYPLESPFKTGIAIINDAISNKIKRETAIYIFKGTDYGNKGMFNKAIEEFNKAVKNDPNCVYAYNSRGSLYAIKGDYDNALSDFNQVISIKPKYAKAYLNRGNIYSKKGQYDDALSDYNQALQLNPRYANAYYSRGLFYYNNGLIDKAISDYTKAAALYSKFTFAYYARGLAYLKKALYEQAVVDFNKVLQLNPKDISAYYYKAVACEGAGLKNEALQAYAIFVRLAPLQGQYKLYLRLIENANRKIGEIERKIQQ